MEKTKYGVKTSLLEELISFQLRLKRQRVVFYNIQIIRNAMPPLQATLVVGEDTVHILNITVPCVVRREHYIERGEKKITLILHGLDLGTIEFESVEEKNHFKQEISREWTPSPPR